MEVRVDEKKLKSCDIIDIGCGKNIHPEADIGVDIREDTDADIIADITEEQLPISSNSVSKVYAIDTLEHIPENIISFIGEIYRILKIGGALIVKVPGKYYDPPSKNPLHQSSFDPQWFYSWDPSKPEHSKWDNFSCYPFNVSLLNKERVSSNPISIIRRKINGKHIIFPFTTKSFTYKMEKLSNCTHHPTNA